jgi:hypothetical protein
MYFLRRLALLPPLLLVISFLAFMLGRASASLAAACGPGRVAPGMSRDCPYRLIARRSPRFAARPASAASVSLARCCARTSIRRAATCPFAWPPSNRCSATRGTRRHGRDETATARFTAPRLPAVPLAAHASLDSFLQSASNARVFHGLPLCFHADPHCHERLALARQP